MSLLREIQDAATSGATPLADALRKCKILAARLQNKAFARG
jgi:Mg-chelatase subunit ChlD